MNTIVICFLLASFFSGYSEVKNNPESVQVVIYNSADIPLQDAVISVRDDKIISKIESDFKCKISIESDTQHMFQLIKKNGELKELLVLCDLEPYEKKILTISKSVNQSEQRYLTQAELSVKVDGKWEERKYVGGTFRNVDFLRVPEEHTDHSNYIRYEGPGWESDKTGYRFYLDWRNAIDIFGKKVDTLVLQNVGLDGFDSYHEMSDWGVDILKVGNSLGIGSVAFWAENKATRVAKTDSICCRIAYSGALESKIITRYYGWDTGTKKIHLVSKLSIQAGSRLTKHKLKLSDDLDNICTGIVKHPEAEILLPADSEGEWTYFATYGKQTLENDLLGMAVFYKKSDLIEITEDQESHVIILSPQNKTLKYYFGAAWEQEKNGIKNKKEFIEYINGQKTLLNSEIKIEIKQGS